MGPALSGLWTWAPDALYYYYPGNNSSELEISEPFWSRATIWVQQKHQWDCGIACALMVLKWAEWLSKHDGVGLVQIASSDIESQKEESNTSFFSMLFATGPRIDISPPEDLLPRLEMFRKQAYDSWPFSEKPLWTVDIALMLQGPHDIGPSATDPLLVHSDRPPFQLRMYTSCKGISPESQVLGWYQADLASDQSRVEHQFRRASQLGIKVVEVCYLLLFSYPCFWLDLNWFF